MLTGERRGYLLASQPLENITPLVLQPTLLNSKPLHTQVLDKVSAFPHDHFYVSLEFRV